MNFSTLIHGAIGHLTAEFLDPISLAQWSHCDRAGRNLVDYAFLHVGRLNLDHISFSSVSSLASFCRRIRGLEVLTWTISHPALSTTCIESMPTGRSNGKTVYKSTLASRPLIDAIRYLHQLILVNASTLRVIRTYNNLATTVKVTMKEWYACHTLSMLAIAHHLPRLECLSMKGGYMRPQHMELFVEREVHLAASTTASASSSSFTPTDPNVPIVNVPWIGLLAREIGTTRIHTSQKLYDESCSLISYFRENLNLKYHSLASSLRALDLIGVMLSHLDNLIKAFPLIKIGRLCLVGPENEEGETFIQERLETHSNITSSSLTYHFPSFHFLSFPIWSNLICFHLLLTYNSWRRTNEDSVNYEIRAPHLLELYLTLDIDCAVSDVGFHCPELVSISITGYCQKKLVGGSIYSTALPPSFFPSVKKSHKLRYLELSWPAGGLEQNFLKLMTQEEIQLMYDRAQTLYPDPLLDRSAIEQCDDSAFLESNRDSTYYQEWRRALFYALSTLPCARTLEMISRPPYELSLKEYLTLFPSVRSLDHIPQHIWNDWSYYRTTWFRPEEKEDIGCRLRIKEKWLDKEGRQQRKKQADHDIHKPLDLDLAVCDYWHISLDDVKLTTEITQLMSRQNRLQQLVIIYLSTPSWFESEAITQIFTECRQLKHATLNQLVDIGNSVFLNLPTEDNIRPALETLRIKIPCGVTDTDSDATFDARIIPTLVKIFPSLHHFEFLLTPDRPDFTVVCSSIQSAILAALESSNHVWSYLRALALNGTSGATENEIHRIMLRRAKMAGVKNLTVSVPTSFLAPFGSISPSHTHRLPPYQLQFVEMLNRPDCNEWVPDYYSAKLKKHIMRREKIALSSEEKKVEVEGKKMKQQEEVGDASSIEEEKRSAEEPIDNRCFLEYVTERCCNAGQCLLSAHREKSTYAYHQEHQEEFEQNPDERDELA